MKLLTRIAPTPSGYLHIGNIFSFALTQAIAIKYGGQVMLRIDDLDGERCRQEFLDDIFECLQFLGIKYDDGPLNPADFLKNYSQQLRVNQYEKLIQQLEANGHLYACRCSRKHLTDLWQSGIKRCNCRQKKHAHSEPGTALKLFVADDEIVSIKDEAQGIILVKLFETMGDFVVRRRNGIPSYQVSSLCDDSSYGINYIVRGQDLLGSTAAQLHLARLTGITAFSLNKFLHHDLLKDDTGEKLSKSAGSYSIKAMIKSGKNKDEILAMVDEKIYQVVNNLTDSF